MTFIDTTSSPNTNTARRQDLLLLGHGLLDGAASDAVAAGHPEWARRNRVLLRQLPLPAYLAGTPGPDGRANPPQVAERLAELDELEELFEEVGAQAAAGQRVLGLAVPAAWLQSRSGRAWVDRVRGIAASIAGVQLAVWAVPSADPDTLGQAIESVRPAS